MIFTWTEEEERKGTYVQTKTVLPFCAMDNMFFPGGRAVHETWQYSGDAPEGASHVLFFFFDPLSLRLVNLECKGHVLLTGEATCTRQMFF